jgi:hypothetical protein
MSHPPNKLGKIVKLTSGTFEVDCGDKVHYIPKSDRLNAPGSYNVGDRIIIRAVPVPEDISDWDWVIVGRA